MIDSTAARRTTGAAALLLAGSALVAGCSALPPAQQADEQGQQSTSSPQQTSPVTSPSQGQVAQAEPGAPLPIINEDTIAEAQQGRPQAEAPAQQNPGAPAPQAEVPGGESFDPSTDVVIIDPTAPFFSDDTSPAIPGASQGGGTGADIGDVVDDLPGIDLPDVDPAPVDPAPVDPAPVDPAPVDPAPVDPAPVDPAPVDPAPVDPTIQDRLAKYDITPAEIAKFIEQYNLIRVGMGFDAIPVENFVIGTGCWSEKPSGQAAAEAFPADAHAGMCGSNEVAWNANAPAPTYQPGGEDAAIAWYNSKAHRDILYQGQTPWYGDHIVVNIADSGDWTAASAAWVFIDGAPAGTFIPAIEADPSLANYVAPTGTGQATTAQSYVVNMGDNAIGNLLAKPDTITDVGSASNVDTQGFLTTPTRPSGDTATLTNAVGPEAPAVEAEAIEIDEADFAPAVEVESEAVEAEAIEIDEADFAPAVEVESEAVEAEAIEIDEADFAPAVEAEAIEIDEADFAPAVEVESEAVEAEAIEADFAPVATADAELQPAA